MSQQRIGVLVALTLVTCLVVRTANAQNNANVTLSVASAGTPFPVPAVSDYIAGYIDNPVTLAFNGVLKGPANGQTFTAHVEVCALGSTLGNGKSLSDLQWRPADLSLPFQPVVLGCDGAVSSARQVGSYVLVKNQLERKFADGILLRLVLRWTDTSASYGVPLAFTVSMTSP